MTYEVSATFSLTDWFVWSYLCVHSHLPDDRWATFASGPDHRRESPNSCVFARKAAAPEQRVGGQM